MITYFENLAIELQFFMFLTHMSNFMSIGCYLLLDPLIYFLCIILNYKNLKLKHLNDDIVINL